MAPNQTRLELVPGAPGRAPRILWVEDDVSVAFAVRPLIENLPARVHVAETGDAAVEAVFEAEAASDPFDLVIIDMWVPPRANLKPEHGFGLNLLFGNKSGCSVFTAQTPVIVYTAHDSYENCVECTRAFATDYLPKAHNPEQSDAALLVEKCRQILYPQLRIDPLTEWLNRNIDLLVRQFPGRFIGVVEFSRVEKAGIDLKNRRFGEYAIVDGATLQEVRALVLRNPALRWERVRVFELPLETPHVIQR